MEEEPPPKERYQFTLRELMALVTSVAVVLGILGLLGGLLAPPGDAAALAQAMIRIMEDPAEARQWAEAGRRTVLERFTMERHVASIQAIYERMLGASRQG